MNVALELNNVLRPIEKQTFTPAKEQIENEGVQLLSLQRNGDSMTVKEFAAAISDSADSKAVGNKFSEKLKAAEEKLQKAQEKVNNAQNKVDQIQDHINKLKDEIKNTKNPFKKIKLGVQIGAEKIALLAATAALKIAHKVLQAAKNAIELLRKTVE